MRIRSRTRRRALGSGSRPPSRIRRVIATLVTAALAAMAAVTASAPALAATVTFTPGAAWNDTSGNPLQLHGLGIIKVGGTWYGFGEDKTGENSGNTSFQDIPCYSSTDLSTWTRQGPALTRQASGDLGPGRIVERPKVLYNASTGEYVMYVHIDNSSYTQNNVGVAVSKTVCGPYTYLGSSQPLGNRSRDIGLFQDPNGTAYLLSEDPNRGLCIYQLSADYLSVTATVAVLPDYEAPAMVKIGGTYYLLASHLTGWATNDDVYATAASLAGPWSSFRDFAPAGTNTYNSQSANIIPVTGTSGTTYIYAGDRWKTGDLGTSPLIWLPLTISGSTVNLGWQNSWSLDTTAGTWSAGASNPATGTTHHLTNAHSGLVMDVSGASAASGGKVIQWTDHGGTNQQWTIIRVAANLYTVRNVNSGLCLEAPNQSAASGVQLDQGVCTGATSQQWAFDAAGSYASPGDASYLIVNLNSGLAADDFGNSTSPGTIIDQWATNGGNNQTWTLS